jgi:hypothetical protein
MRSDLLGIFFAAHTHLHALLCILPPYMHAQYMLLPSHYLHAQPCGLVQDTSFSLTAICHPSLAHVDYCSS